MKVTPDCENIIRCEKKCENVTYQIFYFDFSDWWKKDFDLDIYLRKLFTKDYYSNPGYLQWNYYLVFLYDFEEINESKKTTTVIGEKKLIEIEKNEDFAKKFVVNCIYLENWLEERYKVNVNETEEISQDLSLLWVNKLRESDLDCVYSKNINIQDGVDYYIAGTPFKETGGKEIDLYQKSLRILEKCFGSEHPEVARTLNDMAMYYTQACDYEKALLLYQRALEIVEKKLGQNHPNSVTIKNNYKWLLSKMSKEDEKIFEVS